MIHEGFNGDGRATYCLWSSVFCLTVISALVSGTVDSRIKMICTAALIPDKYELRKQEYIQTLEQVKRFGFDPYVIESCQIGPTFLDALSAHVWYAQTNDYHLKNKGVNEVKALLHFFEHNKFDDDDIIVKLTGRYLFIDDNFLKCVASHPEYDAFVKDVSKIPGFHRAGDIFTGCFAMRYKYLIEFLKQLKLDEMERRISCIEWELSYYIASKRRMKTYLVNKIGMKYRFANGDVIKYI